MSWFSSSTPQGVQLPPLASGNLHPVSARYDADKLFGPLAPEDTHWLAQGSGFVTETQTFYVVLPDGRFAMYQVIHSSIGLWYPQIQFTFRYFDPKSKEKVWKSKDVTNFKSPPPAAGGRTYDKRSCRSDQFSILIDPASPDTYKIVGKYDDDVHLDLTYKRAPNVPGWKLGSDARGGMTYFGSATGKPSPSPDTTAGSDGYMVHRFWPTCYVSGQAVVKGRTIDMNNGRGTFIHAIQGMRPNLLASRWNFGNFQTADHGGVSLTLMEFTTVAGDKYGPPRRISVGSIVVGDNLVAVTCGPASIPNTEARAEHQGPFFTDPETGGYQGPSSLAFSWKGATLVPGTDGNLVASQLPPSKAEIKLVVADANCKEGSYTTVGLIEKVDVMAHIPKLVKSVIAAVAGARPYIYTWINPSSATVEIPAKLVEESGGDDLKSLSISGYFFNEATFVSP